MFSSLSTVADIIPGKENDSLQRQKNAKISSNFPQVDDLPRMPGLSRLVSTANSYLIRQLDMHGRVFHTETILNPI